MTEKWKDIVGYKGLYQISDMGRVKRIAGPKHVKGKILKSYLCIRGGYPQVKLCKNGQRKHKQIHHLILEAFCEQRPTPKHETRHLDGNPQNFQLSNLKWGTRSENVRDAVKHKTHFAPGKSGDGSKNSMAKLTEVNIPIIRDMKRRGLSSSEIAKIFKVHRGVIHRVIHNLTWKHIK